MILNLLNDIPFKIRREKKLDEVSFSKVKKQLELDEINSPEEIASALKLLKDNFEEVHCVLNNSNLLKVLNNDLIVRSRKFEMGMVDIEVV